MAKQRMKSSSRKSDSHLSVFFVFLLGGIGLSLTSFTMTGNAVGGLTTTSQGLLGALLFIVGLTGIFFRLRK